MCFTTKKDRWFNPMSPTNTDSGGSFLSMAIAVQTEPHLVAFYTEEHKRRFFFADTLEELIDKVSIGYKKHVVRIIL
jgi:hypothetical protein